MRKFTVFRDRWLRGEGGPASALLRVRDNKMCCLGFLSIECGIPEDMIREVPQFDQTTGLAERIHREVVGLMATPTRLTEMCCQLMDINDAVVGEETPLKNVVDSEEDRERRLTELFALLDVSVEFRDGAGG